MTLYNTEILLGRGSSAIISVDVDKYPNGEPLIKPDTPWSLPHEEETHSMLLRPKTMDSFFAAMFYVDALQDRGYTTPHLIFPFALGARQDRLNTSGDFLFTAKSIAKEINLRNFPSVTVVDCHSEVMPALIDRCRNIPLAKLISLWSSGINLKNAQYDGVISPDAGAEKRASAVAVALGVPLIHGWKKRNVTTGALDGFGIEPIEPWPKSAVKRGDYHPRFLIVDDICDGGGTFVGLADHIKNYRVKCNLDLLVTHGLFSNGVVGLYKYFDTIFTTDSIIRDFGQSNLVEIKICESLLRGTL